MRIDAHSHILPGIDDGSDSLDMSIEMLKLEAQQGIEHVIATPHFYAKHDNPDRFIRRRDRAEVQLREEMAKHSGLPTLSMGAEVYFFRGISQWDALADLTFGEKKYILLEMPVCPWTESMLEEVEQIYTRRGITPVIAHVDRYIRPFRTHGIPHRLAKMPVLVQANAGFFLCRSTRNMALKMLRCGQIHLLGSDCHNLSDRSPCLGAAYQLVEDRLGSEWLCKIDHHGAQLLQLDEYII